MDGTTQPPKRTLLEISADIQRVLDESEGEVTTALEALEIEEADKIDAYAVAKREIERRKLANKQLKDDYAAREEACENDIKRLLGHLDFYMQKTEKPNARGLTSYAFYTKTQKVVIEDAAEFCKTYAGNTVLIRTKHEPNVSQIKALLTEKVAVEGAKLVENKTLQLR